MSMSFPWDIIKAQTLRYLCKDIGIHHVLKRDEMVHLLTIANQRGVKAALNEQKKRRLGRPSAPPASSSTPASSPVVTKMTTRNKGKMTTSYRAILGQKPSRTGTNMRKKRRGAGITSRTVAKVKLRFHGVVLTKIRRRKDGEAKRGVVERGPAEQADDSDADGVHELEDGAHEAVYSVNTTPTVDGLPPHPNPNGIIPNPYPNIDPRLISPSDNNHQPPPPPTLPLHFSHIPAPHLPLPHVTRLQQPHPSHLPVPPQMPLPTLPPLALPHFPSHTIDPTTAAAIERLAALRRSFEAKEPTAAITNSHPTTPDPRSSSRAGFPPNGTNNGMSS